MAFTKRVTGVEVARIESLLQPTNTLLAGAVSEGLRHHRAAGLALQGVIADGGGGVTSYHLTCITVGDRDLDAVFTEGKRCLHLWWKPASGLSLALPLY